ncbi:MAG: inositol monophosphatase family protein [Nitriliruptor sp.]|uniref:inositol monophosphatase family protein n=1 Tax=Nitriliruptor sp. TaxID=2448056 RepID=UPI0034A06777
MSSEPTPEQLAELVGFAHHLADLADAVTLPGFSATGEVERKGDGTPVTAFDRAAERAIRGAVRDAHPGHAFLGEEDGLEGDEHAPRWVVDPIDGTKNYVRGNPIWATLIALQVGGQEVVGVVSAPALGSRWDGVRGGHAHQDGRVIRVSDTPRLEDADVSFGGLSYFADRGMAELVPDLAARTARQRGYGDFWQHCLVAAGACDLAIEAEVSLWDLAAVKVVVEAAGGRFTDLAGVPTADGGSAISSNGRLHDAVLERIAAVSV